MKLIQKAEASWIRNNNQHHILQYQLENGDELQETTGTGRAICRCCGQKIKKGEPAYKFLWDFSDLQCGSNTLTLSQIHKYDCRN
jgi:hypothetical protein